MESEQCQLSAFGGKNIDLNGFLLPKKDETAEKPTDPSGSASSSPGKGRGKLPQLQESCFVAFKGLRIKFSVTIE